MQSVYLNLFLFKHLHELDTMPEVLHEEIFQRTFAIAQLAQFSPEERKAYEDSIKYYRDLKNSYDTAHQEGWVEGLEAGEQLGIAKGEQRTIIKMVQGMQANGLDLKMIAAVTGLTEAEIKSLLF